MMMKKTTSALAVAALLGTGAASAATFQMSDDTAFSIDGRVYVGHTNVNDAAGDRSSSFGDYSRFQINTEQDLGSGMTAFSGVRINTDVFQDSGDNTTTTEGDDRGSLKEHEDISITTSGVTMSRGFVGIRGDFGTVTVGKYSKVYDSLLSTTDVMDNFVPTQSSSDTSQRQIRYSMPAIGALTVHTGLGLRSDDETAGDESSIDVGFSYDLGAATINAAYDQAKFIGTGDEANYGASVTFDVAGLGVSLVHHVDSANTSSTTTPVENDADTVALTQNEQDITGIGVSGSAGQFSYAVVAQDVSPENGDSKTEFNAVGRYSLSSNMYLSAEYQVRDEANDEDDGYGVSLYYGF